MNNKNINVKLLKRIDELTAMGQNALNNLCERNSEHVNSGGVGFKTGGLCFIQKIYGIDHSHYKRFDRLGYVKSVVAIKDGIEILNVIRQEIEGDWLLSIKSIVSANLFFDFLEMAQHLLSKDYKDAAAVIIGSVLEKHLTELCLANNIELINSDTKKGKYKKIDQLNTDLTKNEVYGQLENKNVTAFLQLRNYAAHGKYEKFKNVDVENMYNGVLNFLTSNPIS